MAAIAPRPAVKGWMTFSGAGSPAVNCISCRAIQARQTTLALQFLLAGAARNESGLLISLSETEDELRATAPSHGWSLESIHIHDISALEQLASLDFQQIVFQPAEVELIETTRKFPPWSRRSRRRGWCSIRITELRLLAGIKRWQQRLNQRRRVLLRPSAALTFSLVLHELHQCHKIRSAARAGRLHSSRLEGPIKWRR
jgi:hypothetical protein